MIYSLLADLTVLLHALFVLFVVLGGLAVLRRPRLGLLHLPAALWGGVVEIMGWICPLTYLENRLRRLGGSAGYGESFIEHYLQTLLYPPGLTPRLQVVLGLSVLALNAVIYFRLWRRR